MTYDDHDLSGFFPILLAATVAIRAAESRKDFALAAAENESNCIVDTITLSLQNVFSLLIY